MPDLLCNHSKAENVAHYRSHFPDSADGPIRPPYAVYFQGGLTWYHAKLGILLSLQKLVEAGLTNLPEEEQK